MSFSSDTSGVIALAPGVSINPAGVASVTVAGLGTATFTGSGVAAVDDQALGGAGIGAEGGGPPSTGGSPPLILGTIAPTFAAYDLTSATGPITGSAQIDPGAPFPTTSGDFVLTSAGDTTFTAVLTGSAVPEPGSLAVLGAGLVSLACGRRARRASPPSRAGRLA